MAPVTVNVFRWSALGLGIVYGAYHSFVLSSQHVIDKANREYAHKEKLISEAKAQYNKLHPSSSGVISDPADPNFDLEKLLLNADKLYQ